MAPLPPAPILILSLSVEPGTLALIIIGLAALVFAIAQAVHGPDVLRSEEDWLERGKQRASSYCQLVRQLRFGSMETGGQLGSTG